MAERPLDNIVTACRCGQKLSMWMSKSSDKFASWGRMRVSLWNGAGWDSGTMLWISLVKSAGPNESSPLVRRVLHSRFLWRGLKVSFQAFHIWLDFGFPSHYRRSLGKEFVRRRDDVANTASQLSVIRRPACWSLF